MLKASYLKKSKQIKLLYNDVILRQISPQHLGAYKFELNNEECYFIYEEEKRRNTLFITLYLYPINMFKQHTLKIQVHDTQTST